MATLGQTAVTLLDYSKRMTPNGEVDTEIIETLSQSNPILQDLPFLQGNLTTGNQTTQRTSLPRPHKRRVNRGIPVDKSSTKQIVDTCCILEGRSQIDTLAIRLYEGADRQAFRTTEDAAFIEGFGQEVADMFFYGSSEVDPDEFNGLSLRYPEYGGVKNQDAGYQVISAGSTADNVNTSAFLVGMGKTGTAGIYPKNTAAGLKAKDLGEDDVPDASGNMFRAVTTLFTWDVGLKVADMRANALVRNINAPGLMGLTAAQKLALMLQFVQAKNRIRNLNSSLIRYVWYLSDTMIDFLEGYLIDKTNVHVTRQELMGQMPTLYISGIPVKRCEAISETEKLIPAKA